MNCQASEVERVEMMTMADIDARVARGDKFTPDSLAFLEHYKRFVSRNGHPAKSLSSVKSVTPPGESKIGSVFKEYGVPIVSVLAAVGIGLLLAKKWRS